MTSRLLKALEGPNGVGFDTARLLFAGGGIVGIFAPVAFQAWALHLGQEWHPAEFCAGYLGGLGTYLGAGGLGISLKDKGVASALNTTAPSSPDGGQP
jgi:hypothetical protein